MLPSDVTLVTDSPGVLGIRAVCVVLTTEMLIKNFLLLHHKFGKPTFGHKTCCGFKDPSSVGGNYKNNSDNHRHTFWDRL